MRGKQNREPPAYQEYAATMLADARFRAASLAERGLLYQLRLECWANRGRVPSDPRLLASYLGIGKNDFETLYPAICQFFFIEGETIYCPELEDYRKRLDAQYQKKSAGGKKGAAITNAGKARVSRESSDKTNTNQTSKHQDNQAFKECPISPHDEWLKDYEDFE